MVVEKNIIFFGDSNTHGYDANTGGRFPAAHRFARIVAKNLGDAFNVVEEGLGGRTTCFEDPLSEGLNSISCIHPILMSHEPITLLVIMLGTNDTKQRFGATPQNIGEGLGRLILKAKNTPCWGQNKPNILIICPPYIRKAYESSAVFGHMGAGCSEKSQALGEVYRDVAELHGCHYLDFNFASMSPVDSMHLTAEDNHLLAEKLTSLIPTLV